jgi:hypothetical protein
MNLSQLKDNINNNRCIKLPLIFINENDNNFLIKTYIYAISKNNSLKIKKVDNLNEIIDIENSMFKEDNYLYIYEFKKDDIIQKKLIDQYNIIIISSNDIKDLDIEKVIFNKLEPWQIQDYIKQLIPGLNDLEIDWLCKNSKYDIYRLNNEADKINIFEKKDQNIIFKDINEDNGYSDLNELTIFNLSNAILIKDMVTIKKVIKDINNIDIEGTGLVTILLKNFLNILDIQTNRQSSSSNLGIGEKQFKYIKYNQCNKYSDKELFDIYTFLTSIDYKLKSGLLDMTNHQLTYYILSNIFSISLKNS